MKLYVKYKENGKYKQVEVKTFEDSTAIIQDDLSKRENVENIKIESDWFTDDDDKMHGKRANY